MLWIGFGVCVLLGIAERGIRRKEEQRRLQALEALSRTALLVEGHLAQIRSDVHVSKVAAVQLYMLIKGKEPHASQ